MAPNVPYSGVPSVAPGGVPMQQIRPTVDPASFGVNVAQAWQGLGKAVEGAGDELFKRGIAMQDLYNHSIAQEADAKYMIKAGELHANYNSLQGKAAVDAYPQYMKDLQKTREEIGNGLPNESARKLFDGATLSTMSRTIFNGAGHAAAQNKQYAIGASNARISATGNQALLQPEDERSFREGLTRSEQEVRQQGVLQGQSPEAIDEAVSATKSALWSNRIRGLAKQQPLAAGKMLEDATKRGELRGEDIGKVTTVVQQARNTVGARQISNQVSTGADNRWGSGLVDIGAAAEAIGTFESGGRYDLRGPEVIDKRTGRSRGQALGKYQVMPENLAPWLSEAGMPSMTEDQFLKSASAQDQLFKFKFGQYMQKTGSFNDAASMWFTGQPMAKAGNVTDAQPGYKGTSAPAYIAGTNAILARNAPLSQKEKMATEIASKAAPDDPLFVDFVQQRVNTDHSRVVAVKRDDEFRNRQTIEEAIMGGADGRLPTTIEELTANPKASQAWEDLSASSQRRYMKVLSSNAKGDRNWTNDSLREYQSLKGQAAADPATFIDLDVVSTNLPNSAKRELINLQGRLKGKAEADPRVMRALNILGPDLQAAGIERRNKDDYFRYVGALEDQLKDFAEREKRPPKYDEVQLMGRRLLQEQKSPWMFGLFEGKTPTFQVPVPDEEAEKIKASGEWSKMSITPTPEQIQRTYTRALYQRLYGGAVKADPLSNSPSPPSSK